MIKNQWKYVYFLCFDHITHMGTYRHVSAQQVHLASNPTRSLFFTYFFYSKSSHNFDAMCLNIIFLVQIGWGYGQGLVLLEFCQFGPRMWSRASPNGQKMDFLVIHYMRPQIYNIKFLCSPWAAVSTSYYQKLQSFM